MFYIMYKVLRINCLFKILSALLVYWCLSFWSCSSLYCCCFLFFGLYFKILHVCVVGCCCICCVSVLLPYIDKIPDVSWYPSLFISSWSCVIRELWYPQFLSRCYLVLLSSSSPLLVACVCRRICPLLLISVRWWMDFWVIFNGIVIL